LSLLWKQVLLEPTEALWQESISHRDFMNVGKYVLQAFWEVKKLELNKVLLKQITEEANS
jgi:hypothetical protein